MSTLNSIANMLNMNVNDLISELNKQGIYILNPYRELTQSEIQNIDPIFRTIVNSKESLKQFTLNYKIFIDTSSFMHSEIGTFCEHIYPFLKRYNAKIIVPHLVINELNKHFESSNEKIKNKAYSGLFALRKLIDCGVVTIIGDKSDSYADNAFLTYFTRYRLHHNLLLVTQDKDLSKDLLSLNNSKSVKSAHRVKVKRINKYGYLSNLSTKNPKSSSNNNVNMKSNYKVSQ